jgi:hypothetical protein
VVLSWYASVRGEGDGQVGRVVWPALRGANTGRWGVRRYTLLGDAFFMNVLCTHTQPTCRRSIGFGRKGLETSSVGENQH